MVTAEVTTMTEAPALVHAPGQQCRVGAGDQRSSETGHPCDRILVVCRYLADQCEYQVVKGVPKLPILNAMMTDDMWRARPRRPEPGFIDGIAEVLAGADVVHFGWQLQASRGKERPDAQRIVCLSRKYLSITDCRGRLRAIAAREFPGLKLDIDSAGTADYHVGEPPDRRTVAAARRRGYDLAGLRARRVQKEDFSRFNFVLAMDRANLAELERLRPGRIHAARAVP